MFHHSGEEEEDGVGVLLCFYACEEDLDDLHDDHFGHLFLNITVYTVSQDF